MRLDGEEESSNVEDARGSNGGGGFGFPGLGGGGGLGLPIGGRGLGCGGVILIIVVSLIFGINPLTLLGGGTGGPSQQIGQPQQTLPAPAAGTESQRDRFVRQVLHTTERTWAKLLPEQTGTQYSDPKLLLYTGSYPGGCGQAQSAMGPFYCPDDRKVYLDQSFFDELSSKFGAPGDFAAAYVIAHEIGHHVQHLLGILDKASALQQRAGSKREANAVQVRVELQADCFAGVWANANKSLLEQGDIDQAMTAAASVGDDRLQQQAQGVVVPDSFTHGSSAQRTHWFQQGYQSGKISDCDTFAGGV